MPTYNIDKLTADIERIDGFIEREQEHMELRCIAVRLLLVEFRDALVENGAMRARVLAALDGAATEEGE